MCPLELTIDTSARHAVEITAMSASFPLQWPAALEGLFDFQGAISTAGEHLLNPDCSVDAGTAAELFYAKQIGFATMPFAACGLSWLAWRVRSLAAGTPWRRRTVNAAGQADHTPKDKWVVTVCVILYFMWPTLLGQTWRLFACRTLGIARDEEDPVLFLVADFDEICFAGRHLAFVVTLGVAQIVLFAVGMPLLSFVFLRRHRDELHHAVVKFRYGLFFSGFRSSKYYWECLVVSARKQSIVMLSVFGPSLGLPTLAHSALLVFLLHLLVQLIGRPYAYGREQKLQVLDVGSIIVNWFTMWSGFFFFTPGVSHAWAATLTVVVVAVNACHMAWLVGSMLVEIRHEKKLDVVCASLICRAKRLPQPTPQVDAGVPPGPRLGVAAGSTDKTDAGIELREVVAVREPSEKERKFYTKARWLAEKERADNNLEMAQVYEDVVNRLGTAFPMLAATAASSSGHTRATTGSSLGFSLFGRRDGGGRGGGSRKHSSQNNVHDSGSTSHDGESGDAAPRALEENPMFKHRRGGEGQGSWVDAATGRRYFLDPASGETKWLEDDAS